MRKLIYHQARKKKLATTLRVLEDNGYREVVDVLFLQDGKTCLIIVEVDANDTKIKKLFKMLQEKNYLLPGESAFLTLPKV